MRYKKPVIISVFAIILVLIGAGVFFLKHKSAEIGATQKNLETTKVSLRFPIPVVESGQATFYLAQDNGYYAKEGLEVSFEMGSRELNPVKTVATGQDTFGLLGGPDTLLVARSKGVPVKAIAVIHRHSNFVCLVTLKKSGITQLSQLQGKKIGFFYGHISTDVLRNMLRKNNIQYTEVDVGFDYNQLITGQIDAQWAFTVTAGLDLPAKGIELNFIKPEDYGIVTDGYTLFTADKTIETQPDTVLRFLRASLKGVRAAVSNPAEATQSVLKRAPTLDPTLTLTRQKMYNAVTSNSDQFPPGYMDKEMFDTAYTRLLDEGVIEKPFDPSSAFTMQFLNEIHREPTNVTDPRSK